VRRHGRPPAPGSRRLIGGNVIARSAALVSLGVATVLVARVGGPTTVGEYALLRVIPALVGVVGSAGLPTACAYFLAGRGGFGRAIPWSIFGIAAVTGTVGSVAWVVASPALRSLFFPNMSVNLVALAGATVLSQLLVATAKSCAQGLGDMRQANRLIVLEEATFLPPFVALAVLPIGHLTVVVWALLLSDVGTATYGWIRLSRGGFFTAATRPTPDVVRAVLSYGARGQVGGVMTLVNLRLDFILLGSLAGPSVVGSYAVASKFAELLRVPSLAIGYVLYPRFRRDGARIAAQSVRRMAPRALLLIASGSAVVALCVNPLIPLMYGSAFRPAIGPAYVLVAGLVTDGLAAVLSAWLLGTGRPGLNSMAVGAGVVVTVVLDVLLIPSHHAMGAAIASAASYLTVTVCLVLAFYSTQRQRGQLGTLHTETTHART
jgi:O-antigen/teichoic acid export membrane protein